MRKFKFLKSVYFRRSQRKEWMNTPVIWFTPQPLIVGKGLKPGVRNSAGLQHGHRGHNKLNYVCCLPDYISRKLKSKIMARDGNQGLSCETWVCWVPRLNGHARKENKNQDKQEKNQMSDTIHPAHLSEHVLRTLYLVGPSPFRPLKARPPCW